MKVSKEDMCVYIVTDRSWSSNENFYLQVEKSIQAGATFVQLREKNITFNEFVIIGTEIKKITDKYHIPFVVNDNVDVALAINADGVHIGQCDENILRVRKRLGEDKIIGVSAQTTQQAIEAENNGADYIGVGAMFSTLTKLDAELVKHETLKDICKHINVPVVAIGGINKENILQLSQTGVDGVAVISAIFAEKDIFLATSKLLELSKLLQRGKLN